VTDARYLPLSCFSRPIEPRFKLIFSFDMRQLPGFPERLSRRPPFPQLAKPLGDSGIGPELAAAGLLGDERSISGFARM